LIAELARHGPIIDGARTRSNPPQQPLFSLGVSQNQKTKTPGVNDPGAKKEKSDKKTQKTTNTPVMKECLEAQQKKQKQKKQKKINKLLVYRTKRSKQGKVGKVRNPLF
jgi:hypothetical protein